MKTLLRPAVSLFVLLTVVTGIVYPLVVTGIAKVAFPEAGRRQPDRQGRQAGRLRA